MKTQPNSPAIKWRKLHSGQKSIYDQLSGRDILRCGRRFGKTELFETRFSKRATMGRKIGWFAPEYKLIRPTYKRIYGLLYPLIDRASKTEAFIQLKRTDRNTIPGSVEFWSLDNEDAGRSRDYDDVVIDEASLKLKGLREIVEQAIMPTLLDRRGTLTLGGTPKGIDPENFFYVACTDKTLGFKEFHAPTRMNPFLDPLGVAKLSEQYPPLVYQQEFLAEFVDWSGEAFFSLDKLLTDGQPLAFPETCDTVFAVIDSATKTRTENDGTGVTYYAYVENAWTGPALYVLDWDIRQIEGSLLELWLPEVFARLEELSALCHARFGVSGVWIEDKASGMILLQQATRKNLNVHAIDGKLTALGKSERAINVSGYVYQNKVKITQFAHSKVVNYKGITKNHFLSQVTGFRVGVKEQQDDDLLDTLCYGLALTLGRQEDIMG